MTFTELQKLQSQFDKIKIDKEEKVALYYTLQSQISIVKEKIREFVITPMYLTPFLQLGRMVKVRMSFSSPNFQNTISVTFIPAD